jgi:cytochrome bd-type quinol oxidase subunit 1
LTGVDVLISLGFYILVYLVVYPIALTFMLRKIRQGPEAAEEAPSPIESGMPMQPIRALPPSE